ncbi:MAG: cation:dicarboxylase symporter family transporter, partial [Firmicutes bacterium]|nr:cation:dicarboxylase symporter family transporter [Bacillota bacterium]
MKSTKKINLTAQIIIALILGIVIGLAMQNQQDFANSYIKPFGTIFLNLIKTIVVPLVLFSITQGIISLKDIRKVGSIGGKTVLYYMTTTAFAVTLGLLCANLLQVGKGYVLDSSAVTEYTGAEMPSLMDTFVNIFPSNIINPMLNATMLQVIVISLFFGFGIIAA